MVLHAGVAVRRRQQVAGEVLVEAQPAPAQPHAGGHRAAPGAHADQRTLRRALAVAVRGVERGAAALVVGQRQHAGLAEPRRVRERHRLHPAAGDRDPGLGHRAHALAAAVLAEAVVAHRLDGDQLLGRPVGRRVHAEHAVAPGGAELVAEPGAAGRRAQLERDRPGGREVALIDREAALARTHRLQHLGDHEAEIDVAVAVHVRRLVDAEPGDPHLEIRAVDRVEAAQEELLGLALGAVAGQVQPRHRAQHVLGRTPRRGRERALVEHALGRGGRLDGGRAFQHDDLAGLQRGEREQLVVGEHGHGHHGRGDRIGVNRPDQRARDHRDRAGAHDHGTSVARTKESEG